jgi:hypothetical protein
VGVNNFAIFREQAAHGDPKESAACLIEEVAPGNAAAGIYVSFVHRDHRT